MAVRTNYYPLWEAERGRFKLTHRVKNPRPLKEFVGMIGKFSHLNDEEFSLLEREANERYQLIEGMGELNPLRETL